MVGLYNIFNLRCFQYAESHDYLLLSSLFLTIRAAKNNKMLKWSNKYIISAF